MSEKRAGVIRVGDPVPVAVCFYAVEVDVGVALASAFLGIPESASSLLAVEV